MSELNDSGVLELTNKELAEILWNMKFTPDSPDEQAVALMEGGRALIQVDVLKKRIKELETENQVIKEIACAPAACSFYEYMRETARLRLEIERLKQEKGNP
jgi:hypothetical protein